MFSGIYFFFVCFFEFFLSLPPNCLFIVRFPYAGGVCLAVESPRNSFERETRTGPPPRAYLCYCAHLYPIHVVYCAHTFFCLPSVCFRPLCLQTFLFLALSPLPTLLTRCCNTAHAILYTRWWPLRWW